MFYIHADRAKYIEHLKVRMDLLMYYIHADRAKYIDHLKVRMDAKQMAFFLT